MLIAIYPEMGYYYIVNIALNRLSKKEANLKEIMNSFPEGTNEIVHVVLKSQARNKRKPMI